MPEFTPTTTRRRRRRHTPAMYRTLAELETLDAPERNPADVERLCAVLGLWAVFMLETMPARSAPAIYGALCDVWSAGRAASPDSCFASPAVDAEVCAHHGAMLDALERVKGAPPRALGTHEASQRASYLQSGSALTARWQQRLEGWAALYALTPRDNNDEAASAHGLSPAELATAESEYQAAFARGIPLAEAVLHVYQVLVGEKPSLLVPRPPEVVDFNCWKQSRARPLKRALFAALPPGRSGRS